MMKHDLLKTSVIGLVAALAFSNGAVAQMSSPPTTPPAPPSTTPPAPDAMPSTPTAPAPAADPAPQMAAPAPTEAAPTPPASYPPCSKTVRDECTTKSGKVRHHHKK
jgi:hypothetical protein